MATRRGHTQTPSVHIFLQSATLPKSSLRISPRQITLVYAAVFAVFRPLHTSSCSANHRCYRLSRYAPLERSVAHPPTDTMLCSTTPPLRSSDPPRACIYAKLVNYFFFFSPLFHFLRPLYYHYTSSPSHPIPSLLFLLSTIVPTSLKPTAAYILYFNPSRTRSALFDPLPLAAIAAPLNRHTQTLLYVYSVYIYIYIHGALGNDYDIDRWVGGNEIWCRCGGGRVVVFLRESFSLGSSSSTVTGAKKREILCNIYILYTRSLPLCCFLLAC